MPSDSNGVYTLPPGYLATTGEVIQASQHNPPLEDIASGLTGRLPRSGVAPMTGPLKLADGSASAPALTFNTAANSGIYKTTDGWGISIGGVSVAEFTSDGLMGSIPLGGWVYYSGLVAPAGFIFGYGQTILRSFSPRFTAWVLNEITNGNTDYGAGDGSSTLVVPDYRDYVAAGKGDMGGVAANRLDNSTTLGAVQGEKAHVLLEAELPEHTHEFTGEALPPHTHDVTTGNTVSAGIPNGGGGSSTSNQHTFTTTAVSAGTPTGTNASVGSDTAHNNVQPTKSQNIIIFVGA